MCAYVCVHKGSRCKRYCFLVAAVFFKLESTELELEHPHYFLHSNFPQRKKSSYHFFATKPNEYECNAFATVRGYQSKYNSFI